MDGLWLRGLSALFGAYVVGVIIYFGALYALKLKFNSVRQEFVAVSLNYTNALKDSAQIAILEERQELKYKGLDCLKAVAEVMPENVTMESVYFQPGKLELREHVPREDREFADKFNDDLRRAAKPNHEGETLFTGASAPQMDAGLAGPFSGARDAPGPGAGFAAASLCR